jgi:hypothetical protein
MKTAVFWDAVLCSLAGTDRRFTGAYCPIVTLMRLITEAVTSSVKSDNIYRTSSFYIPEDSHLHRLLSNFFLTSKIEDKFYITCNYFH